MDEAPQVKLVSPHIHTSRGWPAVLLTSKDVKPHRPNAFPQSTRRHRVPSKYAFLTLSLNFIHRCLQSLRQYIRARRPMNAPGIARRRLGGGVGGGPILLTVSHAR